MDMVNALLAVGANKEVHDAVRGLGLGGVPRIGYKSLSLLNAELLIPKAPELSEIPEATTQSFRGEISSHRICSQRCF